MMELAITGGVLRLTPGKVGSSAALTIVLALFALASWAQLLSSTVWPAAIKQPWKRCASRVAARLAVEGKIDLIYGNRAAFAEESRRLGALPDTFEANAPTTILAYLPLVGLPIEARESSGY